MFLLAGNTLDGKLSSCSRYHRAKQKLVLCTERKYLCKEMFGYFCHSQHRMNVISKLHHQNDLYLYELSCEETQFFWADSFQLFITTEINYIIRLSFCSLSLTISVLLIGSPINHPRYTSYKHSSGFPIKMYFYFASCTMLVAAYQGRVIFQNI